MNNKKKWTKSISVALLVALASVATTGLVLADHGTPVEGVAVSSLTSFDQYQAAIDHMESDLESATAALLTKEATRGSFVPYLDEFDQTELDRKNVVITSLTSFAPYPDEFDRMELHEQVSDSDDSVKRWEQYLRHAK